MTFKPGQSGNPAGRPKGVPNKVTRNVRAVFEQVFDKLQETDPDGTPAPWSLEATAIANPLEFYKLAKTLIPQKLEHSGDMVVNVLTGVPKPDPDVSDIA